MQISRIGAASVVAVAFLLSACGGGGGGDKPPPPNQAPVSNAGTDQSVFKGASVTLDGSASNDPDGNALSYRWSQASGPAVSLSSGTTNRPTFTAPAASGTLVFSLIVNDGKTDSIADLVQITVANRVPVADAGSDGTAEAGTLFTLDALGSTDADHDALTYTWTQISGPAVTLTTIAGGRVRFTAPPAVSQLTFGVVVNDGEVSSPQDSVKVNVVISAANEAPVADVYTSEYTMPKRSDGWLSGWGYDPDGTQVTFRWRQISGPTVTVTDASSAYASFKSPDTPCELVFEFVASDGVLISAAKQVKVTVENYAPDVQINALTPAHPRTLDDLTLDVDTYDPDTDPLTVTYAWTRNGSAVPSVAGSVFPASQTTRGDVIAVTVTANDGTTSTSVDSTTTIEDTPPVLSANPPTSVNFGDTVSFQVTASGDDDGDAPGPYVVRLGPAGFDVSSSGAVSWHAVPTMFEDHIDIAWSIGLSDAPAAALSGTLRVNHAARQVPLMRAGITAQTNHDSIVIADIDADGIGDILTTDGRVLSITDKSGSDYIEKWSYPFNLSGQTNGVSAIAAGDATGNSKLEIFTASDNKIRQISGETLTQTFEYTDPKAATFYSLRVADLDHDGHAELVCLGVESSAYGQNGGSIIVILDAADLTFKNRINQTGLGSNLTVANVDADPALEIITAGGFVYDGATLANEWAYGPQFGRIVDTGDIDGDGVEEIAGIANVTGVGVRLFNAVSHTVKADIPYTGCCSYPNDVRLADVDGDHRAEVLAGSTFVDGVGVWQFNTGTQSFAQVGSLASQSYEVTGLAAGNVDADANTEVIWASGVATSGQDVLVVSEFTAPSTLALEWTSATPGQLDGPFIGGMPLRDGSANTKLAFLSPSTASGYSGPRMFLVNPADGTTSVSDPLTSSYSYSSTIMDVADTDGDSLDELLLSNPSNSSSGWIYYSYDLASKSTEWSSPASFSSAWSMTHADLTGDGKPEVVAMGGDSRVTVLNPAQSTVVWQSAALDSGPGDVAVADIDHDGVPELVALTNSTLYVFGRTSNSGPFTERGKVTLTPSPYYYGGATELLVADTDGDGEQEIYVAFADGSYYPTTWSVKVFDRNLQSLRTLSLSKRVTNFALEPGTTARRNLLISTAGDSSSYYAPGPTEIWAIDPVTGAGVWRSPAFAGEFGRNSLNVIDQLPDGQYKLSFGTVIGAFVTR